MSGASQANEANAPAGTHGHTGLAHAMLEEAWPGGCGDAATSLAESEEEAGGGAASNDNDFDRNEHGGNDSDDSDGSTWAAAAQAAAASAAVGAAMAAAGAASAAAEAAMAAADAPRPGPPSREPVERNLTRASTTADAADATALAAQPARPDTSAVSLTALFDSGPDPHRGATCRPTCGANRALGQHSGGVTSAFTSLHEIANQALSAGGHVAMEISTTTSARQARPGPPPGAPPPPGATQLSQRCTYPTVYPAAYSTATAVTACPDEVPLAEASVLWQGFSPDGFGEVAPGYALASAAPKGRRRKQSAARSDAHGNHWQWTHGPLSVEEAWRDQHYQDRVTEARQQAEAEGLVLQSSAQSASGYKGVAINKLPHAEKGRPRPYQAYVVRGEKKMHLGSFAVPEEAALAVARELAAEAAWAAQNPLSVAPSAPARAPAAQSEPAPPPPPLAPGTKVAIRGLTGR